MVSFENEWRLTEASVRRFVDLFESQVKSRGNDALRRDLERSEKNFKTLDVYSDPRIAVCFAIFLMGYKLGMEAKGLEVRS